MNRDILEKNGIDYAAGLGRFMEDEELYDEMLTAFLSDDSFSKASEAFSSKDYTMLFEQAHAIKGVSGNLDMRELYRASGELSELLRHDKTPARSAVAALFEQMELAYHQVVNGICAASK